MSATVLRRSASAELDAFVQNGGREADLEDAVFQMEITYRVEGYAFATVSYTRTVREDLVQAVFTIAEGPRVLVDHIEITGRTAAPADDLAALFAPSKLIFDRSKNHPFVQSEIQAGISRVRDFYLARGYLDVNVGDPEFSFSENRTRVSITIPLSEGRLYRLSDLRFRATSPRRRRRASVRCARIWSGKLTTGVSVLWSKAAWRKSTAISDTPICRCAWKKIGFRPRTAFFSKLLLLAVRTLR